jgi:hypothetical protein
MTLERFQAKWKPVRVEKTRQIKNLEPRFDSIETEKALAISGTFEPLLGGDRRKEKCVAKPHNPLQRGAL